MSTNPCAKLASPSADATARFFSSFHGRFRGVEMGLRGLDRETPPIAYVTARKIDFGPTGAIEQFIRTYDPER